MNYKQDGPLLILSRKSFSRYMSHLTKKQFENEELEREKAHRKYLKQKSHEMASSWPDSIQNIKNREKEKIEMKEKQQDQERTEQVQHYKHFHEEERKHYLDEAREKIKMRRYPNSVLSNALLESHIRAENAAILVLKKEKEREEAEDEARWIERIHESEEKRNRREEEEICEARRRSKMVQTFQLNQIKENSRKALNKKSQRLKKEQYILEKMDEEMRQLRDNENEDARKRKKDMKQNMRAHTLNRERAKQIHKKKEAEEQAVCNIYNDFYTEKVCHLEKQRRQKMNDFAEANHKLGFSNKQADDDKEARQNQIYANYCMEMEKTYEQERCRDTKLREDMVKELNAYYRDCRAQTDEENQCKAEIYRYELAERLKNAEEVKKYDEQKNKKMRESKVLLRKEWDKQIEEKKERTRNAICQNSTTDFYQFEDKKFISYAKEVLEYASVKGMDLGPIKREINDYCEKNQLPPYPKCLGMEKKQISTFRSSETKLPKI